MIEINENKNENKTKRKRKTYRICSASTNGHIYHHQLKLKFPGMIYHLHLFLIGKWVVYAVGWCQYCCYTQWKWTKRLDIFQHKLVSFYIQITVLAHQYISRDRKIVNAVYQSHYYRRHIFGAPNQLGRANDLNHHGLLLFDGIYFN